MGNYSFAFLNLILGTSLGLISNDVFAGGGTTITISCDSSLMPKMYVWKKTWLTSYKVKGSWVLTDKNTDYFEHQDDKKDNIDQTLDYPNTSYYVGSNGYSIRTQVYYSRRETVQQRCGELQGDFDRRVEERVQALTDADGDIIQKRKWAADQPIFNECFDTVVGMMIRQRQRLDGTGIELARQNNAIIRANLLTLGLDPVYDNYQNLLSCGGQADSCTGYITSACTGRVLSQSYTAKHIAYYQWMFDPNLSANKVGWQHHYGVYYAGPSWGPAFLYDGWLGETQSLTGLRKAEFFAIGLPYSSSNDIVARLKWFFEPVTESGLFVWSWLTGLFQ